MTKQALMEGWLRPKGTLWMRRLQGFEVRVTLGRGGWWWTLRANTGEIVNESPKPHRRSRQARRESQRLLFRLVREMMVAHLDAQEMGKAA